MQYIMNGFLQPQVCTWMLNLIVWRILFQNNTVSRQIHQARKCARTKLRKQINPTEIFINHFNWIAKIAAFLSFSHVQIDMLFHYAQSSTHISNQNVYQSSIQLSIQTWNTELDLNPGSVSMFGFSGWGSKMMDAYLKEKGECMKRYAESVHSIKYRVTFPCWEMHLWPICEMLWKRQ